MLSNLGSQVANSVRKGMDLLLEVDLRRGRGVGGGRVAIGRGATGLWCCWRRWCSGLELMNHVAEVLNFLLVASSGGRWTSLLSCKCSRYAVGDGGA